MTGNKLLHSDSKYSNLTHPHDYHCLVVSERRLLSLWTFGLCLCRKKLRCEVVTLSDNCLLFRCPSSRAMVLHSWTLNAKHDKIKCLLWHLQVLIRVKLSLNQKPFIYLWRGHSHRQSWWNNHCCTYSAEEQELVRKAAVLYVSVTNPDRIKSINLGFWYLVFLHLHREPAAKRLFLR